MVEEMGGAGRAARVRRAGKAALQVGVALCLYMAMGYGMRQGVPPPQGAIVTEAAIRPSDFPAMPAAVCRRSLDALRRSYRDAPLPGIRADARADYDALVVQMDADALRAAHLPPRLP